jgi:hypothetical protein
MDAKSLITTIDKGVASARNDHLLWTDGSWLTAYGVESLVVARIATEIMEHKKKPARLTMETSINEIEQISGQRHIGRRSIYQKPNNRIDIALLNRTNITHTIEVKRFWSPACGTDIMRLSHMSNLLKNTTSYKFGVFVMLIEAAKRSKNASSESVLKAAYASAIANSTPYLKEASRKYSISYSFHEGLEQYVHDDDYGVCSSLCIKIKANN